MGKVQWALGVASALAAVALSCVSAAISFFVSGSGTPGIGTPGPWRTSSLAGALVLLGLAFLFHFHGRARAKGNAAGAAHGRPAFSVWSGWILWTATAAVAVFASLPYLSGSLGLAPGTKHAGSPRANAHLVLAIEGMDCPVCAAGLQNSLRQIPGVRRAEVSFQDKQAALDYDPGAVQPLRINQAVAEAGFKVTGALPGKN